jgi:serine/threonine protein kinase
MDVFNQEVSLMMFLGNHKNMIQMLGYIPSPQAMLLKYLPLGSLEDFNRKGLPGWVHNTFIIFNIVHGTAEGLRHMHSRSVAHCDIKTGNILLEKASSPYGLFLRPVLTDFGISQILTQTVLATQQFKLTNVKAMSKRYAAPEVIQNFSSRKLENQFNIIPARDVYALACVIYETMCRRFPWD